MEEGRCGGGERREGRCGGGEGGYGPLRTFSTAIRFTNGPCCIPSSRGSPTLSWDTASLSFCTNSSWIPLWTSSLPMQEGKEGEGKGKEGGQRGRCGGGEGRGRVEG